jgi:prepilin-type N-terminal cleavage/methylation domain-containing protein
MAPSLIAANAGKERRGFTMVELLVVVALIVLLLSVIVPAAVALRQSSKRRSAAVQVQTLAQALTTYRAEYGKWPCQSNDAADATYVSSAPIVAALATDSPLNPRRQTFIEIPASALVGGDYVDPWGSSFVIAFDANGDGTVELNASANGQTVQTNIPNSSVVVFSWGPDPEKESRRIYSWAP